MGNPFVDEALPAQVAAMVSVSLWPDPLDWSGPLSPARDSPLTPSPPPGLSRPPSKPYWVWGSVLRFHRLRMEKSLRRSMQTPSLLQARCSLLIGSPSS